MYVCKKKSSKNVKKILQNIELIFSQSAVWNIAPLIKTNFDWSTSTRNHAQKSLYPWSETYSRCPSWLPSLPLILSQSKLKKKYPQKLKLKSSLKKSLPPPKNIYTKSGGAKLISQWRMYITICESRMFMNLFFWMKFIYILLCVLELLLLPKVSWFQLFVYYFKNWLIFSCLRFAMPKKTELQRMIFFKWMRDFDEKVCSLWDVTILTLSWKILIDMPSVEYSYWTFKNYILT